MMRNRFFTVTKMTTIASAACLLLAACFFGSDDPKRLTHVETGMLEDLPRVGDPATATLIEWRLKLDEDAPVRGQCNFTGYLGDSAYVEEDEANPDVLYTNSAMGGTHSADWLRNEGVILSLDTAMWQGDSLTHYRAEFRCRY